MGRIVTLEKYYPNIMKAVREFQHIAEVENDEFNTVWKCVDNAFDDEFIETLTANGCSRWESILKMPPASTDSLATRRKNILIKINTLIPYTHRTFQGMLNASYGKGKVNVSLNYAKYECWLNISMETLNLYSSVIRAFTRKIIPANLTINVSNTQTANLNEYCGATMQKFKHITIHPSVAFTVENSPTAQYSFGGGVKRLTHITLRS